MEWKRKDLWSRRGRDFCVEISHREEERVGWSGRHRWNIYAYIYPKHHLFDAFDGDSMFQQATENLPMHGGPSSLQWHRDNTGTLCSVQVGCDYNHIDDEAFTHTDVESAESVFRDAEILFAHLQEGQDDN